MIARLHLSGLLLLVCVACGPAGAAEPGFSEVQELLRATHYVRAMVTEAHDNDRGGTRQDVALLELTQAERRFQRWALLYALAEEHERLSWREDGAGPWHGERAACLYIEALASEALGRLPQPDFSALFNRTALAVQRLMPPPAPPPPAPPPAGLSRRAAQKEQDTQCAATRVEYERWRDKRDDVTNFALGSAFHPLRWLTSEGLATKKTVHIDEVRSAFRHPSLDATMRPVVENFWRDFSPEGGVGAADALADNSGTDLREIMAAVHRWRETGLHVKVGGARVQWWHELLHACAVDGVPI